jgi:hypothetical protein
MALWPYGREVLMSTKLNPLAALDDYVGNGTFPYPSLLKFNPWVAIDWHAK